MLTLRPHQDRGHANHGWLDTYHTFSFADYYDSKEMGFSCLRVINEDRVAPGRGFGMHPHANMEIITIILEGTLEHKDSMGNAERIVPGEVQRMSAGTGVRHSESNPDPALPVHLLQIWIEPSVEGGLPGYEQKSFPAAERRGKLQLVASPDGREGSLTLRQDARLFLGTLEEGDRVTHPLNPGRRAFIQVATGALKLNDQLLQAGDGVRVERESQLNLVAQGPAEVLLFDLP